MHGTCSIGYFINFCQFHVVIQPGEFQSGDQAIISVPKPHSITERIEVLSKVLGSALEQTRKLSLREQAMASGGGMGEMRGKKLKSM